MKYWTPRLDWERGPCFILGGGPSLTQEIADRIRGHRTIAVNCAYQLAPWADILLFNDYPWLERHLEAVERWQGLVVSTSLVAAKAMPLKIRRLLTENRPDFPPAGAAVIRNGRTSGHKAVSLAIALGMSPVVLLGFDMRLVDGRSHFHDEYRAPAPEVYEQSFIPSFAGWSEAARRAGAAIVNATAGSALSEFQFVDLDDILKEHGCPACAAS